MKISSFKTDENLEQDGKWFDIGNDAKLLLARAGGANKKYRDAINRKLKPLRRLQAKGNLPDEISEKIVKEALAETVLLNWSGLLDDDGNPISYSRSRALELLEIRAFRELVSDLAGEEESFRNEIIEEGKELLKNM